MPRGTIKILRANGAIILETTVTNNMRVQIPASLKDVINPPTQVKVTIEKVGKKHD